MKEKKNMTRNFNFEINLYVKLQSLIVAAVPNILGWLAISIAKVSTNNVYEVCCHDIYTWMVSTC